jgi:hypothetical protein
MYKGLSGAALWRRKLYDKAVNVTLNFYESYVIPRN